MKALVFHGVGDIRVDDVPEPRIEQPNDAVIRVTASAICGTDLHMIRGTMPNMVPGTILGHEAVGIVEEVGPQVRNFSPGDRVVVAASIACGNCSYCRDGYYSQCDNANPNGLRAGTAFFGGPRESGPFNGLQAEMARIPFANVGLVKVPESVTDNQAIFVSDIFPTAYFGADLAEIKPGDVVAIFGCGPVGQLTIASAMLHGAGRVIAVDRVPSRLDMARTQGAEVVNFEEEDPVQTILELTGGIGPDRVIDAVGVDAQHPHHGPAAGSEEKNRELEQEVHDLGPDANLSRQDWKPGDAPSQALLWETEVVAKAGTLAIIGVYPSTARRFPIGLVMNKNLTINTGNCNHRKYMPMLLDLIESGTIDPAQLLTEVEPLSKAVDSYRSFDHQEEGWLKVELVPGM